MKLYIKTPYPNESVEDAPWTECNTSYMKRVWKKHNKNSKKPWALPTKEE